MDNLDEILNSILLHLEPDFFKGPVAVRAQGSKRKQLERYNVSLFAIKHALKKVMRYPVIFQELYPADESSIKNEEALEHHIHAYLEDLDRLRNKIGDLVNVLKNDLKQIAQNKKEVEGAMKTVRDRIEDIFANVKIHRHPHHHNGMTFFDENLIDVTMASMALDPQYPIRSMLSGAGIDKMQKMQGEKFDEAKSNWVSKATKNSGELSRLVEELIANVEDYVYQVLEISPFVGS